MEFKVIFIFASSISFPESQNRNRGNSRKCIYRALVLWPELEVVPRSEADIAKRSFVLHLHSEVFSFFFELVPVGDLIGGLRGGWGDWVVCWERENIK